VAVYEIFVTEPTSTGDDVAGDACGEGDLAGVPMARYSVMKREPPPATRLIAPKKPRRPRAGCGWSSERSGHPGELAGLGDDGVVGAEGELETGMVVPRMRFCMVGSV